jgi:cyclopropane-fatty-acyl-phospholipid synthase
MSKKSANRASRFRAEQLLAVAGVSVGDQRPWDIQVHQPAMFSRVLAQGSLGLGESYMDGWWDCQRLDEFFFRILRARLDRMVGSWRDAFRMLKAKLVNLQSPSRAFRIGKHHYDIGNELYRAMLDKRLIYSCGCWDGAASLDEAQEAKLELIGRKLDLEPGMRVLDIGCGWGGTAHYLADRYRVEVVGVTVSQEQVNFATQLCRGLPVEIRYQDYRDLDERFDRILSVGMLEHVGPKNYGSFMNVVRRCLDDSGLGLLHCIGIQPTSAGYDPWIARYIFPNSQLPSARQLCQAVEGRFVVEDWENLGANYDRTLLHWFNNFQRAWPFLKDRYDERFYRMWRYYLLCCAGAFRARINQVWQIVLSPHGVPGGYRPVRASGLFQESPVEVPAPHRGPVSRQRVPAVPR